MTARYSARELPVPTHLTAAQRAALQAMDAGPLYRCSGGWRNREGFVRLATVMQLASARFAEYGWIRAGGRLQRVVRIADLGRQALPAERRSA